MGEGMVLLSEIQANIPILGSIRYSTLLGALLVLIMVSYITRSKGWKAIYFGFTGPIIWATWFESLKKVVGNSKNAWTSQHGQEIATREIISYSES